MRNRTNDPRTTMKMLVGVLMASSAVFSNGIAVAQGKLGPPQDLGTAVKITNNATGQCLEILSKSIYVHGIVSTAPCHGEPNQQWLVRYHPSCLNQSTGRLNCSDVIFINVHSGLCLNVPDGNPRNGLQQFTCDYGNNQKFLLFPTGSPDGGFTIGSYATTTGGGPATFLVSPGPNKNVALSSVLKTTQDYFWSGILY